MTPFELRRAVIVSVALLVVGGVMIAQEEEGEEEETREALTVDYDGTDGTFSHLGSDMPVTYNVEQDENEKLSITMSPESEADIEFLGLQVLPDRLEFSIAIETARYECTLTRTSEGAYDGPCGESIHLLINPPVQAPEDPAPEEVTEETEDDATAPADSPDSEGP